MSLKIPTTYVVIMRDSRGRSVSQHVFDLPGLEVEDRYTQLTAFQTFMQRELARSQSTKPHFYCTFTDIEQALDLKILKDDHKKHKSVWNLFIALNYDSLKQEYV
jgi:hypothetical protein